MEPVAAAAEAEAADPLAYLPAHLLDDILSRVDLCDAVRISTLSRAWRRRWESVPGLYLYFPEGTPPSAIGSVLLRYTAPRICGFACEVDEESAPHLDHWLIALSHRSVESIYIRAYLEEGLEPERFPLHSSIFSCAQHLVSLCLELCAIPPIPVGFAGFPVLEELYLSHVEFQDPDVIGIEAPLQAIIRRSPLLLVLSLDGLRSPLDNVIQSPNLHSLTLCAVYDDEWCFGELPCLQNAKFLCCTLHGYDLGESPILHSSIFSCAQHLVSLDLELCRIPPIPVGFAGFPVLEELYLSRVEFQDPDVMDIEAPLQAIIHGSPLLRVLFLDRLCSPLDNVIASPNLHSLTLCSGHDDEWCFGELPCLQNAKIFVLRYVQLSYDLGGFLAGLYQVRELTFLAPDEYCDIGTLPTFYNLKSLELVTCFTAIDPILVMFSLMRNSPNLEKFKIEIQNPEIVADWEFLNAQWTDDMCANLQIVEIISDPINRWLPISFMKLILSKASLLRTLSVDVCLGSQDNPLNELLTCRRASAQAQVLFEVQLERFWDP